MLFRALLVVAAITGPFFPWGGNPTQGNTWIRIEAEMLDYLTDEWIPMKPGGSVLTGEPMNYNLSCPPLCGPGNNWVFPGLLVRVNADMNTTGEPEAFVLIQGDISSWCPDLIGILWGDTEYLVPPFGNAPFAWKTREIPDVGWCDPLPFEVRFSYTGCTSPPLERIVRTKVRVRLRD